MGVHKVLISDSLHPDAIAWLKSQPGVEVNVAPKISREELLEIIGGFDALIVRGRTQVGAEEIQRGQRLRVIGRAGTGLDNINVKAAQEENVLVLNAPGANANAVAELTIGLMLSLARHLPEAFASREKLQGYGWELEGKRLGIVGLGRIGSRVAHLASAFGMQLIAHEPDPNAGPTDLLIQRVDLMALLRESEVITLHVPLIDQTRHLLGVNALHQVHKGVMIVNTARAEIVDEASLLAALDEENVSGYAADVVKDERLTRHSRVVLTPHIGAQTEEAQRRAGLEIVQRVAAALRAMPG
ncbi:MAG: hypothetical protein A2Z21_06625 [Candidatus Fraserbacteria bacterium RBG_16_55_9]|uniref:Phosphoglycerate dehydrogenase n=1 Tax=Fraserbacteria sp. (strain RBG_16_55_9) TaxID=1817864 RepID=A0A1F5UWC7_FRAXR|nr:MAG: hypothetical protein A2Z21_06625 [Candidatus Fraserbacteria bacterium RBG_16_55_9]